MFNLKQLETSLSKGDVFETHSYKKRFLDAKKVRRNFYLNPMNILRFFWWLLTKNPMWIVHMSLQVGYFVHFIVGTKELLLKATDNKKRTEELKDAQQKHI